MFGVYLLMCDTSNTHLLYIYIYIYIYMCVCVCLCIVIKSTTIYPTITLVSYRALSEAYAARSSCILVGPVARNHCRLCLSHQRTWSTWQTCLAYLRRDLRLPLIVLALDFIAVLKIHVSTVMTLQSKSDSMWTRLVIYWHTCELLLIIIQQFRHYFCALLPCPYLRW